MDATERTYYVVTPHLRTMARILLRTTDLQRAQDVARQEWTAGANVWIALPEPEMLLRSGDVCRRAVLDHSAAEMVEF